MLGFVEEIVLLQLDDNEGGLRDLPRSAVDIVIAGAAMMELALLNRIDTDVQHLMLVSSAPTGDDILDDALSHVRGGPDLTVVSVLEQLADRAETYRERALKRLVEKRILREEEGRFLWVFHTRRYPVIDDTEQREVKTRLRQLLLTDEIPDPRDVVLICLIEACELLHLVLTDEEIERTSERVNHLSHLDLIGQEVTKAVGEIRFIVQHAASATY
jgi:hypothetical protein